LLSHLQAWWKAGEPKGFGNFYPKNGAAKKAGEKGTAGASEDAARVGATRSASSTGGKEAVKGVSGKQHAKPPPKGGAAGKHGRSGPSRKTGPSKPPPATPPANEMFTMALGAAVIWALTSGGRDDGGQEIDWQLFKTQLLGAGEVERIVVVNKTTAKVVLRSDVNVLRNGMSGKTGAWGDSGSDGSVSTDGHRDPYQFPSSREDPAAAADGDKYATGGSGGSRSYPGPRIGAPGMSKSKTNYYFTIGSIESFERKLEIAQRELGISTQDFVPVQYVSETNWGSELMKFAPTLLIVGLWLFMMRGMSGGAGGMGGGGGGMGNIFKVGKSNAKKFAAGGEKRSEVTFKDVAGVDEAKVEVMEFVQFLKDPSKFEKLGAKIPKGALLVGPPGTGKTLLAKAVAGEADVPFFSISGSDFIEMFVGVGPSRVRDLFKEARESAPCIVFIDEIDAVARARGKGGFSGGNDERENTLNQLLVEMDGFDSTKGVVVLAGTNRADILDPAILRPGRFDRQVAVEKPDIKGRRDIFQVHLKGMQLDTLAPIVSKHMEAGMNFEDATLKAHTDHGVESRNMQNLASSESESAIDSEADNIDAADTLETSDLFSRFETHVKDNLNLDITVSAKEEDDATETKNEEAAEGSDEVLNDGASVNPLNLTETQIIDFFAERMAALTPGFAGAEIANICNEAAIIAARTDEPVVGLGSFEKAADRVIGGIEKPNKIMTPLEKRTVAYHEAGHAIVGWFSENASPLLKVTIVPRTSGALGFAQYLPKELNLHTKEQIMDMMCMALGGRAAEELTFGRVTTGASDDLNRVTQMAYSMVRIYGMNDKIGNVSFPPSENQMEMKAPYSDSLAQIMDEEARKIVDDAYERTKALLAERHDELVGVAEKLLEKETLNQDDVVSIVGERPFDSADDYESIISSSWKRKGDEDADDEKEVSDSHAKGDIGGLGLAAKSV
jgi:AFG3 family protein